MSESERRAAGENGGDGGGDENGDISTANTLRERAGESRLKLWLLLKTSRLVVTGVLAAAVFVAFVVAGALMPSSFRSIIASSAVLDYIFSTMLGAVITGTTLVVTINQLVLSQETGPLGDQRKRMSDAMDFRTYAGELMGETTPSDPSAFLQGIVGVSEDRANHLREVMADSDDEDLRDEVEEFTDSLIGNAQTVKDQLDGAEFGTFAVLFAALNFNYSWKVFQVERITDEYDDVLTDEQKTALDDLRTSLVMFGPAREHIKTLYFQWALVDLSQLILYAAIPALVVSGTMLAFLQSGSFPGATLGVSNVLWVTAFGFTVTLVPFLLFTSYVLRIATVAKRTLAIGPLILRDSQQ
ncbi:MULTISPECIES: hypothetical protein [Halorussus]|uniref:hypothetical protein n=1 Tax=Halorussus TaxID=1070314 RepID=UPI00209EEE3F|nr:hypothetical protein [Halorussus vallis]USZ73914.1 hypothetical protein NGM07_10640 [Halorussus vallis]